jgi:peptidoglycan/xylan/chitin deacetylase (PgdA/CDA1 family)
LPTQAAVIGQSLGRLDVFGRGIDNGLYQKTFVANSWSDWHSLGGALTAEPAAVYSGNGRIDVFVRGSDFALYHRWFNGSAWSPWEFLGGALNSAPAVSSWQNGRLDVFAISFDQAMYQKTFDGTSWGHWHSLGGRFTANPAAVSWAAGRIDVFGRGTDMALWHAAFAGRWSGWDSLGGILSSGAGAASWGPNRLDVFVDGSDGALYQKWWDGVAWRGWQYLGGHLTSDPAATSTTPGSVDVVARGTDRAMWHLPFRSTGWEGWESLGGVLVAETDVPRLPWGRPLPSSLRGTEWTRLPTTNRVVALTFDAGSGAEGLPSILATLQQNGVRATFFLTGLWVDNFPTQARQLSSNQAFAIGNHSYDHPYLTTLPDNNVALEIGAAEGLILRAGRQPAPLFRFPYGDSDWRTISIANRLGYGGIRWTVDTLGWKGTSTQSVSTVVNRVLANLQPGEIVLMHMGAAPDGSTLDADALPTIISELRSRGYSFVTVADYLP